jgi:hypothetical protein
VRRDLVGSIANAGRSPTRRARLTRLGVRGARFGDRDRGLHVIRGIRTEIPLGKRDGLPKRCVANADSIVTIPKTWLESRIASLHAEKSSALDAAPRFALALQ